MHKMHPLSRQYHVHVQAYIEDVYFVTLQHCLFYSHVQGDMGATPLFYAVMQNSLELVRLLCDLGSRVDTTINFEGEVRSYHI